MTFVPEYRFNNFYEVTPEFLISMGVKGIILDIDNTLEPYEHDLPGEDVKAWLKALTEEGIAVSFVSNNNKKRVTLFNGELNYPAFYKAGKPFSKNIKRAMIKMGTGFGDTILMGDQIFTDVFAAHLAKIPAILVPPINDKRDIITRAKRLLERPVLRKYDRLQRKREKNR